MGNTKKAKTTVAEPSFEVWSTRSAQNLDFLSIYLPHADLAALHNWNVWAGHDID